ncbi:MAG: hypothetical protein WCL14_05695 [Bacteroidota bacterium]
MGINKEQVRYMTVVERKIFFMIDKIDHLGLGICPLTPTTKAKVIDFNDRLIVKKAAVASMEGIHTNSEEQMVPMVEELAMFNSHYFTTIINGVKRGYFPLADKGRVGLDIHNDAYPPMNTYAAIILVGKNINIGDALRITAGSLPMAMPSIGEMHAKYTLANNMFNENSTNTQNLIDANVAHMGMLDEGIALCNKCDNEMETFYNDGDKATMRAKCRLWGMIYYSAAPIAYFDLTALSILGDVAIEHVIFTALPGNETAESDIQGYGKLNMHHFGPITIQVRHSLYVDVDLTINIGEEETIVRTIILSPR